MAASDSRALAKRSSDTALMPPPPLPTKRQKRPAKVLDEDVYSDAVSHIIARDFFPGLLETEAQQEYMAALDSKNNDWIRDAGRKLTQVMTPGPEGRRRMGRGKLHTTTDDYRWRNTKVVCWRHAGTDSRNCGQQRLCAGGRPSCGREHVSWCFPVKVYL